MKSLPRHLLPLTLGMHVGPVHRSACRFPLLGGVLLARAGVASDAGFFEVDCMGDAHAR